MKIQILRKMRYQNVYVYVLNFDYCFQYLFPYGAEIYQNHIFLNPPVWKRILYRLGLIENLYSREQLEEGEKIVLSGAMKTIDELNDPKAIKERRKLNRKTKKENKLKECLWQTREGKVSPYYLCLVHKKTVPMVDGVQPKHN